MTEEVNIANLFFRDFQPERFAVSMTSLTWSLNLLHLGP